MCTNTLFRFHVVLIYIYLYLLFTARGLMVSTPGYRSRGPGFHSQHCLIFREVLGLERGPLRLMSTIEELLVRYSSGSSLEIRGYGRGDSPRRPHSTLYPQKLTLTLPTSCGRFVCIVHLLTKAMEFSFLYILFLATRLWR
jgi:hypothetical protein